MPPANAPGAGNKAIALKNCRNRDYARFFHPTGGHCGILAIGVDNLAFDCLEIDINRDGINIDCCRNDPSCRLPDIDFQAAESCRRASC